MWPGVTALSLLQRPICVPYTFPHVEQPGRCARRSWGRLGRSSALGSIPCMCYVNPHKTRPSHGAWGPQMPMPMQTIRTATDRTHIRAMAGVISKLPAALL